jgi:hypothetical protein
LARTFGGCYLTISINAKIIITLGFQRKIAIFCRQKDVKGLFTQTMKILVTQRPAAIVNCRVARWFVFKPKITIWVNSRGP